MFQSTILKRLTSVYAVTFTLWWLLVVVLFSMSTTPCKAEMKQEEARNIAIELLMSGKGSLAVADVESMSSKPWTHGNPPKGKLRIVEVLFGKASGSLNAFWHASPLMLCGNDPYAKQEREQWFRTPMSGPSAGDKVIVLGSFDAIGTFNVGKTIAFSSGDRETLVNAITLVKRERQQALQQFENADYSSLCSAASDIVVATSGEYVPLRGTKLKIIERLKDSGRKELQTRRPMFLWDADFPYKAPYRDGAILFLQASPSARDWMPPKEMPKYHGPSFPYDYERITFRYLPIKAPIWAFPNNAANLQKVKAALSNQPVSNVVHPATYTDEVLELMLMEEKRGEVNGEPAPLIARYQKTYNMYLKILGPDNNYLVPPLHYMSQVYKRMGQESKAKALDAQVDSLNNAQSKKLEDKVRYHPPTVLDW